MNRNTGVITQLENGFHHYMEKLQFQYSPNVVEGQYTFLVKPNFSAGTDCSHHSTEYGVYLYAQHLNGHWRMSTGHKPTTTGLLKSWTNY
jgi:hypothetical protein